MHSKCFSPVARLWLFAVFVHDLRSLGLGYGSAEVILNASLINHLEASTPWMDRSISVQFPGAGQLTGMWWLDIHSKVSSKCGIVMQSVAYMSAITEPVELFSPPFAFRLDIRKSIGSENPRYLELNPDLSENARIRVYPIKRNAFQVYMQNTSVPFLNSVIFRLRSSVITNQ